MNQDKKNISIDNKNSSEQIAKYTAKDSVFTSLFRDPKYLLQLYQALHPEDYEVTEKTQHEPYYFSNLSFSSCVLS